MLASRPRDRVPRLADVCPKRERAASLGADNRNRNRDRRPTFQTATGLDRPTMPPHTSRTDRSTCLAVVPAYNERATVAGVIEALHRETPQLDVLVIDDGSTDTTALLAERAGAQVLRMPFNLGIGGAVQAGFKFAAENGYDYMVQVDGDGQHDPGEIRKLFAAAQGPDRVDMICGSRFSTDTGYIAPISRRTGIHLFAFLLSLLLRQPVTDPTSGFRLYNRRAISLFARDYPHDYPEVEAVLMLHHSRLTMREVPVRMFQRGGGASSISSHKSFYYMVKVLLALFVGLGRRRAVPEPGDAAPVAAEHGI
jgi:glycosyltransferase involved in cell wall biosynthesis